MKPEKFKPNWVCYLDHPTIGSGWRLVAVRQWGWKWIFLTAWGDRSNFKMTLKKWATINKAPVYKNRWGEWWADWRECGYHENPIIGVELHNAKSKPKTKRRRKKVLSKNLPRT